MQDRQEGDISTMRLDYDSFRFVRHIWPKYDAWPSIKFVDIGTSYHVAPWGEVVKVESTW